MLFHSFERWLFIRMCAISRINRDPYSVDFWADAFNFPLSENLPLFNLQRAEYCCRNVPWNVYPLKGKILPSWVCHYQQQDYMCMTGLETSPSKLLTALVSSVQSTESFFCETSLDINTWNRRGERNINEGCLKKGLRVVTITESVCALSPGSRT